MSPYKLGQNLLPRQIFSHVHNPQFRSVEQLDHFLSTTLPVAISLIQRHSGQRTPHLQPENPSPLAASSQ